MKARKICRCCAYPFPHRERGGKCADEREVQKLQAALNRMLLRNILERAAHRDKEYHPGSVANTL